MKLKKLFIVAFFTCSFGFNAGADEASDAVLSKFAQNCTKVLPGTNTIETCKCEGHHVRDTVGDKDFAIYAKTLEIALEPSSDSMIASQYAKQNLTQQESTKIGDAVHSAMVVCNIK